MMRKNSKIYIAGHKGLVGSSMVNLLKRKGYENLITASKSHLDLTDQNSVRVFFQKEKPDFVFLAAAKAGGILANSERPAEFVKENLLIQTNVIHEAHKAGVKKLLFLGSSCIYPKDCKQPIKEKYFLTGSLEPTNKAYATAKIAGIIMCQSYNKQYGTSFISAMPTNLYGPNDNFDLKMSHVIPALIRKFHEAKKNGKKEVILWGTGKPKREFLYVDDLAKACLFLMNKYNNSEIINIGIGKDISIKELAETIKKVTGWNGKIKWDITKPDGTHQKLLDVNRIHKLGWQHEISLKDGLKETYNWFQKNYGKIKI